MQANRGKKVLFIGFSLRIFPKGEGLEKPGTESSGIFKIAKGKKKGANFGEKRGFSYLWMFSRQGKRQAGRHFRSTGWVFLLRVGVLVPGRPFQKYGDETAISQNHGGLVFGGLFSFFCNVLFFNKKSLSGL